MNGSLEEKVRSALHSCLRTYEDEHTSEDILRSFRDQANLLFETENIKTMFRADPFERFQHIKPAINRLIHLVEVTDYNRVNTLEGYCSIRAKVRIPADVPMKKEGIQSHVQLTFRYERTVALPQESPCRVSYNIELSKDHHAHEQLLYVTVWAVENIPSSGGAKPLEQEDEDDLWSDMDEEEQSEKKTEQEKRVPREEHLQQEKRNAKDDEEDSWSDMDQEGGQEQGSKKPRLLDAIGESTLQHYGNNQPAKAVESRRSKSDEECDRFAARIDPEVLGTLLKWAQLGPIDDVTAFFLLMTFPFYEHEWDLVGFILDDVFGTDKDDGMEERYSS
jgi:hypothetical protein